MRHRLAACVVLWALAAPALAQTGIGTIVPVEEESFHIPVFHNEYVTLLHVQIPAGHSSGYHSHTRDQLGVVVGPYPAKAYSQLLDEPPHKPRQPPVGNVTFAGYDTPITHHIVNPDTSPIDQYGIMLMSQKPWGFSPIARDVAGYTKVLDNERAVAWRLVLKPGEVAPAIHQIAPGVRVVIRGGDLTEVSPGKRDRGFHLTSRDAYWQDAGATRSVRNTGNTVVELVEFELK